MALPPPSKARPSPEALEALVGAPVDVVALAAQLGNAGECHTACALFRAGLRGTSPPGPPSPPLAAVGQRLARLEAALGKRVRDLEEEGRTLKAGRVPRNH